MRKTAVALLAILGLLLSIATAQNHSEKTGTVQVRIIGPDGKPVAHAAAIVKTLQSYFTQDQSPAQVTVQTDANGVATFTWAIGKVQLEVDVAGHGYGNTGIVAIFPGKTALATLPPLAPWATISGSVGFVGPGTTVTFGGQAFQPMVLPVDKTGHFSAEVRAGAYWIRATTPGVNPSESAGEVSVVPGDMVRDLKFYPPSTQPANPAVQQETETRSERTDKPFVWVRGTVRDHAGRPIAGAKVFATADWFGGIREVKDTLEAVTDAGGHYQIEGQADWTTAIGRVVAYQPGMPPEVAWTLLSVPDARNAPVASPPTVDLILALTGGKLDVLALLAGKPLAGAVVMLQREGGDRGDFDISAGGEPEAKELDKIDGPTAVTGADGHAHFDALPPGRFRVTAAQDQQTARSIFLGYADDPAMEGELQPYGIADGVAIGIGKLTVQSVTLIDQHPSRQITFHLTQPAGTPMFGKASERCGQDLFQSSRDVSFDGLGNRSETFSDIGLTKREFRYAEPPEHSGAILDPCFSAATWIAVSPRMPGDVTIDMTALWLGPAALTAQLEDVAGQPAPGIVEIVEPIVGRVVMIGSTDSRGNIRFDNVPPANYLLRARLLGQRGPNLATYEPASFPADSDLIGQTFVPFQPITLRPNGDEHALLQSKPAAYVRGILHAPAGHGAREYYVYCDQSNIDRGAGISFQSATGRFVLGPLVPGKVSIYSVPRSAMPDQIGQVSQQPVTVQQDKIAVADLFALPPAPPSKRMQADHFTGRVFLADGKTPAYGATVQFFVPGDGQPHLGAITDVTGAFHGHFLGYFGNPGPLPPGGPADPVAVAMIPGACGGAIVDLTADSSKPLSITLPPPIACHGTLTLAGKNLTGQVGRFRVLAEYQDTGNLTRTLSVWATPQADGDFELPGLTPGTYHMQASLDDIWVSQTVTLVAGAKALPDIHLDIPAPAGSVVIHCASAKGKPLCGIEVVVDRPAGPLTDLYAPKEFTTDGAGDARIPALEAGKHTARLPDNSTSADFISPPLPATAPVEVELRAH